MSVGPRAGLQRARVYESLRTAHLERAHELQPATIYFSVRRYDFDDRLTSGLDLIEGGIAAMAISLLRSDVRELEINEPLMRSALFRNAVAVSAVRLSNRLRRRPSLIVSYAIENRDPFGSPKPTSLKPRLRRALDRTLSRFLAARLDRIVYGTPGAQELYTARLGAQLRGAEESLITSLPAPCSCLAAEDLHDPGDPAGKDSDLVVFVGAFSPRKGVEELCQAWAGVRTQRPKARLHLIGKGDLEWVARSLAERDGCVTVEIDPPREEIHRTLRSAAVLVLLSQPSATWREQVGLPILEGLAHGCRIVATTETGLAGWLISHGHQVVSPSAAKDEVAAAICRALEATPATDVLADLPELDSRLAADVALFAQTSSS